jgi:predicted P-loop ATPase
MNGPSPSSSFNGAALPPEDFPNAPPPNSSGNGARRVPHQQNNDDELWRTIHDGGEKRHGGRLQAEQWVILEMLRRGYAAATIIKVLLDRDNRVSDHAYNQPDPQSYIRQRVADITKVCDFVRNKGGVPYRNNQINICLALAKMGIALHYDQFARRVLIDGLLDFGPGLDDAALDRIWLQMEQRCQFSPPKDLLFTIVRDMARLNGYHPVTDYLDSLRWDGTPRIDKWLTTYGGADDNEYTRAVGALMLIAAVRRVRKPGCKFDEMLVLECPEQGTDKSTALRVLAVREEWFSDYMPLNVEGKGVIECLRGRWIVEAAELSGMRRADIEHVKSQLSRQVDRARLSYDRMVTEEPRQCVFVGTTNSSAYLRDMTGNRRFWPVEVKRFDTDALRRDRDQLWAEAAAREASGASIHLDSTLWAVAAAEQERRVTCDPWFEVLQAQLEGMEGKISVASIWEILDVPARQQTQEQRRRVGEAMRKLRWLRPNSGGNIKIWVTRYRAMSKAPSRGAPSWPRRTITVGHRPSTFKQLFGTLVRGYES